MSPAAGELLVRLEELARAEASPDPAHDLSHVQRVTSMARRICEAEGGDLFVVTASALLHELVAIPKDDPASHTAGESCAERAREELALLGIEEGVAARICDCIRVHAFSRGLAATTLEAQILQDADRLDAIGAIGIARCFSVCGAMRRPLYSGLDPFCRAREPDDKRWGIDHFYRKLLLLPDRMNTPTAQEIARGRADYMVQFLRQLEHEIGE